MRVVVPVLALLALLPATAVAVSPPGYDDAGDYRCLQTFASYGPTGIPSFGAADRGHLKFNFVSNSATSEPKPSSYEFDAFFLGREARAGGWSWDGYHATFDSGPLARPDQGWSVDAIRTPAARMPHDPVPGRTWPLVLRSIIVDPAEEAPATAAKEGEGPYQASYWYCGTPGLRVRKAVGPRLTAYVEREAGVPVRLPDWMPVGVYNPVKVRMIVLTKGYYRIGLFIQGSADAILSAKRAPASDLGHRRRVDLGGGVTGWVGSYGCAFNGTDPDWGPKYCGRDAIVWHQAGVNYCIEAVGNVSDADLVRAARQAAR
jgi:hypothetical protein